jgi:predicted nucleotidyltransferase
MALPFKIKRVELGDICRRYAVRRLELFGSGAREDFDPAESDLDFLVEFKPGDTRLAFESYFGLKEDLETLFGRPVDLIMPGAVRNPYVRAEIERDRTLLYAA